MRGRIHVALLIAAGSMLLSCVSPSETRDPVPSHRYDAKLAQKLGADEYGMRSYVLVVLTTGPAEITNEARREELFAGHFSNMAALAEKQLLVLAGPFIEGGDKRGLFIFNVSSIDKARELVQSDPAVAAGLFDAEFTRYYGSAALMMVNDIHKTIQKTGIE